ncbi:Thiol-disulfide isomerase or thioredoxin [Sphingomonas antarctica]|uniref:TlpA family protein disulfide reductase n=1 Tax=Sphingomonas antarctica TaxID=2040274 RepID=UPI0039EB62C5
MRLFAPLALLVALAACDRKTEDAPQANAAAAAQPTPEIELAGKLDMTHRGEDAPVAAFRDSQNKPVRIGGFRGTPVLVNLWATWCGPCVRELPSLDRLAVKAAGRLTILTVSQDDLTASDPAAYWDEKSFSALQLYTDPKTVLSAAYASGVLPTSVLYDAKGKEVWRIVGGLEWDGPRANTLLAPVIG